MTNEESSIYESEPDIEVKEYIVRELLFWNRYDYDKNSEFSDRYDEINWAIDTLSSSQREVLRDFLKDCTDKINNNGVYQEQSDDEFILETTLGLSDDMKEIIKHLDKEWYQELIPKIIDIDKANKFLDLLLLWKKIHDGKIAESDDADNWDYDIFDRLVHELLPSEVSYVYVIDALEPLDGYDYKKDSDFWKMTASEGEDLAQIYRVKYLYGLINDLIDRVGNREFKF